MITLPDEPTYDSNDSYCYDFIGWNGYYNGMTVSGSHIFSALFEISIESLDSLIEQASSTNVILIKMMPNSQITLDDVELERILEALSAEGDRKFTLSYDNGKISFDKNSLDSFKWDGIDADIEQVVELTEKEIEATNDRPTYEIKLKNKDGSIKEFKKNSKDGKITIDLPYKLKDGEDKNNLYVSYMENGELKESHDCLYYEEDGIGYVSFNTTHLSKYVIMYDSPDDESGMNIGLIIGGSAILVALLGAGIIFFVRRKI